MYYTMCWIINIELLLKLIAVMNWKRESEKNPAISSLIHYNNLL